MADDTEGERPPFEFPVVTGDSIGLAIQMLYDLQSSLDALVMLVIEGEAKGSKDEALRLAERFEQLRQEFALKRGFRLQDRSGQRP